MSSNPLLPAALFGLLLNAAQVYSPGLDPGFGLQGMRALDELGVPVRPVGTCPHADGSVSLVGLRVSGVSSFVQVRLRPDGTLDTRFSGDGIAEYVVPGTGVRFDEGVMSCGGVGNADPADDRMFVAGRNTSYADGRDRLFTALLDLHAGRFDAEYFLGGGPAELDVAGHLYPIFDAPHPYPRVFPLGVQPAAGGGWLVLGRLDAVVGNGSRGMAVRVGPLGTMEALAEPHAGGTHTLDLSTSLVGADGDYRVLGTVMLGGQPTWGLLRLRGADLGPVALLATGAPTGSSYAVGGGRRIGGGVAVAAALAGDASAFGTAPRLLVLRGNEVDEVNLPQPPALHGETVGVFDVQATGATGQRAIVAGSLIASGRAGAGFYAAVVQLGNGAEILDAVDPRFGAGGSASFRWRAADATCPGAQGPYQTLGSIASWGDATILLGETAPDCGEAAAVHLLGARIDSAARRVFVDSFE